MMGDGDSGSMKKYINANSLFGTILLIVGIILILWELWINWKVKRIASWPKAQATILSSVAQSNNCGIGRYLHSSDITPSTKDTCKYVPVVTYRYRVSGKDHQSTSVAYNGPRTYNSLEIKTLLERTKPGSTVPVYYDRDQPGESYIYPGEYKYTWVFVGLILVALSLYLGYRAYSKGRKSGSSSSKNNNNNNKKNYNHTDYNTDTDKRPTEPHKRIHRGHVQNFSRYY